MNSLSAEHTLVAALPVLLVIVGLSAAIVLLPKNQDTRSKASTPTPVPTTQALPTTAPETPEIYCAELYNPVCGIDNQTYFNQCQAQLAKINIAYQGQCQLSIPTVTPKVNLPQTSE